MSVPSPIDIIDLSTTDDTHNVRKLIEQLYNVNPETLDSPSCKLLRDAISNMAAAFRNHTNPTPGPSRPSGVQKSVSKQKKPKPSCSSATASSSSNDPSAEGRRLKNRVFKLIRNPPTCTQPTVCRPRPQNPTFSISKWTEDLTSQLRLLRDHAHGENFEVITELDKAIKKDQADINKLGPVRQTIEEKRKALEQCATVFQGAAKRTVLWQFTHERTSSVETELRKTILNHNANFCTDIHQRSHTHNLDPRKPTMHAREWLHIVQGETTTAGQTHSGLFEPGLATKLFREQTVKWEASTHTHIDAIHAEVISSIGELLDETCKEISTFTGLDVKIIRFLQPRFDDTLRNAREELARILKDERGDVLISWDPSLGKVRESISKARNLRHLLASAPLGSAEKQTIEQSSREVLRLGKTAEELKTLELYDYLRSYYSAARTQFIDCISLQVVERHYMSLSAGGLVTAFSPAMVAGLSDEDVKVIANERGWVKDRREVLEKRLDSLGQARKLVISTESGS